MQSALQAFNQNIVRVRALGGLFQALENMTTSAVDATDLLRAKHVMCVSALDHYVHDIARIGMMEIFDGRRPPTDAYGRFRITLSSLGGGSSQALIRANFETEIRDQHSYLSFQHPDKISEAIRLFSGVELWRSVGQVIGEDPRTLKDRIRLIVERRNKIAHEADIDPTNPPNRWPIDLQSVNGTVDYVERVIQTIHSLVV